MESLNKSFDCYSKAEFEKLTQLAKNTLSWKQLYHPKVSCTISRSKEEAAGALFFQNLLKFFPSETA